MTYDLNNDTGMGTYPKNKISFRRTVYYGDTIPGQTEPDTADPAGVMVKGPFDCGIWSVKLKEEMGTAAQIRMYATYDLDTLQLDYLSSTSVNPVLQYTDAATTWETITTVTLAKNGATNILINWSTAVADYGLSYNRPPTAVRFAVLSGDAVRVEVEQGIL